MNIAAPPNVQTSGSRLVPSLRYRDVESAIEWLCAAFGFKEYNVVSEPDGTIRHAQLISGSDMIMLLPASPAQADGPAQHGEEGGSAETQSLYFVVDDAEEHYRRAKAAGAEVLENGEYAFGGHGYSCRDPEGHVWHFGTYNPRQEEAVDGVWIRDFLYGNRPQGLAARLRERFNPSVLVAAAATAVIGIATIGWMLVALPKTSASARERGLAFRAVLPPQAEETRVRSLARADERSQASTPTDERVSAARRTEDASERSGQEAAERARLSSPAVASTEASQRTDEARTAVQIADRTVEETLGKVRAARQTAERIAEEALERLRAAQRTAAQAFRQLRAARKAAATTPPGPAEAREQVAATSPAAPTPEQKPIRERAKEAPAKVPAKDTDSKGTAERTGKDVRNPSEAERVKTGAAPPQPARAPVRLVQGQNAEAQGGWDCVPSPPAGQIICHPLGKKAASAKAFPAKQTLFEIAEEPSAQPKPILEQRPPQEQRRTQEQGAGAPAWDCQPSPADGQILCRPGGGAGLRR